MSIDKYQLNVINFLIQMNINTKQGTLLIEFNMNFHCKILKSE